MVHYKGVAILAATTPTTPANATPKALVAGIAHGVLLGAQLLIMRVIGDKVSSLVLSWGMFATCNMILNLWFTFTGQWPAVISGLGRWRQWVSVGVLNGILTTLTFVGVNMSGAANAGILMRTDLLFGLLLGYLLYKERTHPLELAGGGLMLCGVIMVLGISFTDFHLQSIGDLYLLTVGLLLAINAVIIKYGLGTLSGAAIVYFNTLVAGLFLTVVITISRSWAAAPLLLNKAVLPGVIATGIIQTLALLTYYYALDFFPVWIARSFGLITPLVALVGSLIFLGEKLTVAQVGGTALALAGMAVMFVQRGRISKASKLLSS